MSWTQPAFEAVVRLLGVRTGLTFANRADSVEAGIRRAMAKLGMTDAGNYLDRLANDDRILDDLVSDLTVGETYFFREPGQFQRIRQEVLPDIRRRHGPEHVVRAWSAGCASGEEAFTLAMVFEQEGFGQQSHVLATDISQKALAAARRGMCTDWSLRGENGTDAMPYLIGRAGSYKVVDAIRQRVVFAPLNLALDVYPSFANGTWGMDLILCRNVLIYFARDTVQSVARRLFQSLSEGGWLLTGAADPPLWDSAPFEVVATQQGIIYRRPRTSGEIKKEADAGQAFELDVSPDGLTCAESDDPDIVVPFTAAGYADEKSKAITTEPAEASSVHTAVVSSDAPLADPVVRVRALANLEPAKALTECERLLTEAPFGTELTYLHAMLLLDLGKEEQALEVMRRLLYLDRSLAVAHFTMASMLRRRGDLAGARRAYRNSRDLSAALAADAVLPLGEGELAGRLAELAGSELLSLEDEP